MHRFSIKGRFAPAAMAAAAAIAFAGTGSAVAGHLLTGSDIQDSSLRGKDIKNRSLTGSDLKKETLSIGHFKASQQAALKGAQGAQGAQGPKGDKGDQGAPGKDGTAKAYGTVAADGTLTRASGIVSATESAKYMATYCIDTTVPVENAVATQTGNQAPLLPSIDYGTGGGLCPEGTDLTIRTANASGQLTDGGFTFLVN